MLLAREATEILVTVIIVTFAIHIVIIVIIMVTIIIIIIIIIIESSSSSSSTSPSLFCFGAPWNCPAHSRYACTSSSNASNACKTTNFDSEKVAQPGRYARITYQIIVVIIIIITTITIIMAIVTIIIVTTIARAIPTMFKVAWAWGYATKLTRPKQPEQYKALGLMGVVPGLVTASCSKVKL